jgi:manganese/zinc/iron transport system ATP- binding protein
VECENLTIRYPLAPRDAVADVSLSIPTGVRTALVGANGSGKSTLLKAFAGLLRPTSGTIRVHGSVPGACCHRVAYLAQRGELDWTFPMDVRRLVMAGRYLHLGWFARPGQADHAIVDRAMDELQIAHLADKPIGELSGGQQQRALLARAMAQKAELLLLDEPMNAVDAQTRQLIRERLRALAAEGKTIIVATHDLHDIEFEFDRVVQLCDGRVS